MAARLTDRQKKKIVADYVELGSYNAVANKNGVSKDTVKRIVLGCEEIAQKMQQKKEENTQDILAYMESKRDAVCKIIETGLAALPGRLEAAKSATEITTALGTLIDKWALIGGSAGNDNREDELSRSLRELAEGLESDGQ